MTGLDRRIVLAVELEHDAQDAVGGGVGGPEVEDHGLVGGDVDVDVAGVGVDAFGQAQDAAELPAQLVGSGLGPRSPSPGRPRRSAIGLGRRPGH